MPTTAPRINTVLEPPVFHAVSRLARAHGVSLSQVVRDLVVQALELVEDEGLDRLVEGRRRAKRGIRWVSHNELKRRLRLA
ncbi:MAG: toxin-antitoxin system, antitoxin component [Nitrospirae bacterium]|nr:toxin-antitoxin system, antitoxin component [Nitrospirota bacterium]